jgi:hypothetical protein
MPDNREERIRQEAYALWNSDGCPDGKADHHWYEAEKVIDHQDRLTREEDKRGEL